ncbi:MAG: hypothetical protein RIC82_03780, partial [Parvibaculum sp.]
MSSFANRRRPAVLLAGAAFALSLAACELTPEQKYDFATRDLRSDSLDAGDRQDAITDLYDAAKAGHVPAAMTLGDLAAEGEIVEKDATVAAAWYRTAYEAGDPDAATELAELAIEYPDEVRATPDEMREWIGVAIRNDEIGIWSDRLAG